MLESFKKVEKGCVDSAIVRWLYACGVPFNIRRSPYLHETILTINKTPDGYKAPSFENARTSLLEDEKRKWKMMSQTINDTCRVHGVSIISNGWTNIKNDSVINVLTANKDGVMFLYAIECSGVENTGSYIKFLLMQLRR